MASSGYGNFPLDNDRVSRMGLTAQTSFGVSTSDGAALLADYFFDAVIVGGATARMVGAGLTRSVLFKPRSLVA
jgi:tryptophan synthase alpha subunit